MDEVEKSQHMRVEVIVLPLHVDYKFILLFLLLLLKCNYYYYYILLLPHLCIVYSK